MISPQLFTMFFLLLGTVKMFFFLTIENKNKNNPLSINAKLTHIQYTTEASLVSGSSCHIWSIFLVRVGKSGHHLPSKVAPCHSGALWDFYPWLPSILLPGKDCTSLSPDPQSQGKPSITVVLRDEDQKFGLSLRLREHTERAEGDVYCLTIASEAGGSMLNEKLAMPIRAGSQENGPSWAEENKLCPDSSLGGQLRLAGDQHWKKVFLGSLGGRRRSKNEYGQKEGYKPLAQSLWKSTSIQMGQSGHMCWLLEKGPECEERKGKGVWWGDGKIFMRKREQQGAVWRQVGVNIGQWGWKAKSIC